MKNIKKSSPDSNIYFLKKKKKVDTDVSIVDTCISFICLAFGRHEWVLNLMIRTTPLNVVKGGIKTNNNSWD